MESALDQCRKEDCRGCRNCSDSGTTEVSDYSSAALKAALEIAKKREAAAAKKARKTREQAVARKEKQERQEYERLKKKYERRNK